MPLIILLAVAVVAGYLIAKSRASKTIDETTTNVVSTTRTAVSQASDRLRGRPSAEQLKNWTASAGSEYLPKEFTEWLAGLSKEEADAFMNALTDHMNSLGFSLKDLLDGKLADQPEKIKTYSETIAAYYQTYRQVKG